MGQRGSYITPYVARDEKRMENYCILFCLFIFSSYICGVEIENESVCFTNTKVSKKFGYIILNLHLVVFQQPF